MVVCLNPNADDYDESVVRGPKTIFVQLVQSQFYVLDFGTDKIYLSLLMECLLYHFSMS